MISYEHKRALEVTREEEKYLRKLRIEDIGLIWEEYRDRKKSKHAYVVLAKTSKGNPIAWGLLYYDHQEREWTFSIYVKRQYRRKGIGTKIYRKMKRLHRISNDNIHVYRHDDKSIAFFDRLQKRH